MNTAVDSERPRIVIKLDRAIDLPFDEDALRADVSWRELFEKYPSLSLRPAFTSIARGQLQRLVAIAQSNDATYRPPDFRSYLVGTAGPAVDLDELVERLRRTNGVEEAYVDPPGEDPAVDPSDDHRFADQGYLKPADVGIDAVYAWGFKGGDGEAQHFIDMEKGWTLDHEDLAGHGAQMLHGDLKESSRRHGTAVLGEVCAIDNDKGIVGITPNLESVNVVSYFGSDRPNAIAAAADALVSSGPGGVLLLEAQLKSVSYGKEKYDEVPIEVVSLDFEAIRLATAAGIVVVEAGGNGSNNLDEVTDSYGKYVLDRTHAHFRDSGAILVGAATAAAPHARLGSNYGNRIDCYAWGEQVVTTDSATRYETDAYRNKFSGTSSAAAIIAGTALAVQGIAWASLAKRFSGFKMRQILSDAANGTPSKNPPVDRIRVMPDLRKVIVNELSIDGPPQTAAIDPSGGAIDPSGNASGPSLRARVIVIAVLGAIAAILTVMALYLF